MLKPAVSSCWWRMCARSCASGADARVSPLRSASTAARFNPRRKAVGERAMAGPSGGDLHPHARHLRRSAHHRTGVWPRPSALCTRRDRSPHRRNAQPPAGLTARNEAPRGLLGHRQKLQQSQFFLSFVFWGSPINIYHFCKYGYALFEGA